MSKEILAIVKLQINAGKANPAPPIGPALGQRQVNIMEFCKQFNERTKDMNGIPCPTVIIIYKDKTFIFIVKKPPVSYWIKQVAKIESGSKMPGKEIVCQVKRSELTKVAKDKMCDMNCFDVEAATSMFCGTARSMGIEVIDG